MSPSIKSLRRSVVAGVAVLLLVLAVFLGIARFKRHFRFDLPGRLGVDISQTADGFTYSQSQKEHTLFTIHASKLIQYKGDQAELHDVTITLYGPEGSGRTDKIYGSDFTYDRKQGIARAMGAVRIDFASPETRPGSSSPGAAVGLSASTIHVTTSGVVFTQSTGEATTDQRVDFVLARATGSAIGADYNAREGVLVLGREVTLATTVDGSDQPATIIHAGHAQLLRETHQAYLLKAEAISGGNHTTSDQATVTFRPDGSAEHIDAQGHVRLVGGDGAEVHASQATLDLDALSHARIANLSGGVTYYADDGHQTMQGSAVAGTLSFVGAALPGKKPGGQRGPATEQQLHHAQFRDAVTFVVQQRSLAGDPNGSATREMRASKLDIDFAPGPDGKAEAQFALGVGGAAVNLHDVAARAPARSSLISADQLLATLAHGRELHLLDGKGNTKVVDGTAGAATSTSTGDTLHVTFVPASGRGAGTGLAGSKAAAQVDTAVQDGNVELLQVPAPASASVSSDAKSASAPTPLHATAQHADYHAADQVLHLTGDPHLHNGTLALSADRVDYHRDTGDALATGNVKSTYVQQDGLKAPTLGGTGPVHVTADHANLTRGNNTSIFYGAGTVFARMWQGGDAVTAPVLELARDQATLDAHGERGERTAVVHATLGAGASREDRAGSAPPSKSALEKNSPQQGSTSGATAQAGSSRDAATTQLSSVSLHYSDKDRRADFRGSVTAEQPTGTVHADQAQVYLKPDTPNQPSRQGQLDHVVAAGHVVITQPGRRGTGDKLVYTPADGRYVLTGSAAQPPRIVDAEKGTTTGAALIFKTADDSVEVSSHVEPVPGSAVIPATRTVTDTHTPK